ncbi:MAG: hypothetical protein U0T56_02250 [Ferruginibacter sp.]
MATLPWSGWFVLIRACFGTIVQAYNVCSVSATRSLSVVAVKPAVPGVISGLTNVCSLVGQNTTTTCCIAPVADAVSYNWIVPANITIVSGQGTTSLEVSYPTGFTSGTISVQSGYAGVNSASRSLSVSISADQARPDLRSNTGLRIRRAAGHGNLHH